MPETQFTQVQYTLQGLMNQIQMGQIGLPDIQRPFVWKNTKVRDLFDSMYRRSGRLPLLLLPFEVVHDRGHDQVVHGPISLLAQFDQALHRLLTELPLWDIDRELIQHRLRHPASPLTGSLAVYAFYHPP